VPDPVDLAFAERVQGEGGAAPDQVGGVVAHRKTDQDARRLADDRHGTDERGDQPAAPIAAGRGQSPNRLRETRPDSFERIEHLNSPRGMLSRIVRIMGMTPIRDTR